MSTSHAGQLDRLRALAVQATGHTGPRSQIDRPAASPEHSLKTSRPRGVDAYKAVVRATRPVSVPREDEAVISSEGRALASRATAFERPEAAPSIP